MIYYLSLMMKVITMVCQEHKFKDSCCITLTVIYHLIYLLCAINWKCKVPNSCILDKELDQPQVSFKQGSWQSFDKINVWICVYVLGLSQSLQDGSSLRKNIQKL